MAALTNAAVEFTTAAKDSNLDPINALAKSMRPAEAEALQAWIESNVPYLACYDNKYTFTAKGHAAAVDRVLAVDLNETDILAEAKAEATEAKAEAKANALKTASGRQAKANALMKKVKALKADILDLIDNGHDINAASSLVFPLINIIPNDLLAVKLHQVSDVAVKAEAAAKAAKAKAAAEVEVKAAKAEAAKAAKAEAAAEAEAKAAKAEAAIIAKAEAKAAKAGAAAKAKAKHYAELTAEAAKAMTVAAKAKGLNEVAKLVQSGMMTEAEAAAFKGLMMAETA